MHTNRSTSFKRIRWISIPAIAATGLLLTAACGSGPEHSSAPQGQSPPATVAVRTSALGPIAVDASGHTLYRFDKDQPGASVCTGSCAVTWPPAVITAQPTAGKGLAGMLNTIMRADGSQQVALDGHSPLSLQRRSQRWRHLG